jgi:hypothetical protein
MMSAYDTWKTYDTSWDSYDDLEVIMEDVREDILNKCVWSFDIKESEVEHFVETTLNLADEGDDVAEGIIKKLRMKKSDIYAFRRNKEMFSEHYKLNEPEYEED